MLEPALDQLGELAGGRPAVHHGLERLRAHVRVGHAGVRELTDVGRDAVQLLEGLLPRDRARTARRDERSVDVEQEYARGIGHWLSICPRQGSLSTSAPRAFVMTAIPLSAPPGYRTRQRRTEWAGFGIRPEQLTSASSSSGTGR